ncbi:pentapeptide repeat-containing protein [Pseudomonas entomophila]|uniref:pentapeptide repeat-containing protein n=1 Tax=Pseudomonas entomophila TaxID=312306 RepID=UPI002406976C|nr:pentapeptide repeat-containing protein [Pseudomonas entomophila]MDF9620447.1 pentapeptide repeat-containing protein [Pseudomonas entomophila]
MPISAASFKDFSANDIALVKGAKDENHIGNLFDRAWRVMVDWFCNTKKDDACRLLFHVINDAEPEPRCKAFEDLKALASEPFRERFKKALNEERLIEFKIALEGGPVTFEIPEGCSLAGINLSGADLREIDLRDKNLEGVDFSGANLEGAKFGGAKLESSKFNGANLYGADFTGANVSSAKFCSAVLDSAVFINANLQYADFSVDRSGAPVTRLVNATLDRADLGSANFNGVVAPGASFKEAILKCAVFVDADLSRADFSNSKPLETNFTGAQLHQAKFQRCVVNSVVFEDAKMTEIDFTEAEVSNSKFKGADLSQSRLTNASVVSSDMSSVNFEKSQLFSARLTNVDLGGTKMIEANLQYLTIENCRVDGLDVKRTAGDHVILRDLDMKGVINRQHAPGLLAADCQRVSNLSKVS